MGTNCPWPLSQQTSSGNSAEHKRKEGNPRAMNLRWTAPLLLSALLSAPAAAEQPFLTFDVQRRGFLAAGTDLTSPTVALRQEIADLRENGFLIAAVDPESGIPFLARNSTVSFAAAEDGSLLYHEEFLLHESDGTRRAVPLRSAELPILNDPARTINPLMALHPYAQTAPEFDFLRGMQFPTRRLEPGDPGEFTIEAPPWRFVVRHDPETGNLATLHQIEPESGQLFRRTEYSQWAIAPSGRWIPHHVVTRTYRDGHHPITELVFTNIQETAVPETGSPQQKPSAELEMGEGKEEG